MILFLAGGSFVQQNKYIRWTSTSSAQNAKSKFKLYQKLGFNVNGHF